MPTTPARSDPPPARRVTALATGLLLLAQGAAAQDAGFAALADAQSAANAAPGSRQVPGRAIPVPQSPSPEVQALIAAPYSPFWNVAGTTPQEWRDYKQASATATEPLLADLRDALDVTVVAETIGGVPCYVVSPGREVAPEIRIGGVERIIRARSA